MKAAILLNGEAPVFLLDKILKDRYVVCADGAYNWAKEKNIKIDLLVGDFDSIETDLTKIPDKLEIKKFNQEKNLTDGQICLDILIEKKCGDIIFLGGGGKRDDHYFAAIQLLYRALKNNVNCVFHTNTCEIYLTDTIFRQKLKLNTVISLVPFFESAHIMYTKGLKYKLLKQTIYAYESLGISNVATDENVEIKVKNGPALIFVIK